MNRNRGAMLDHLLRFDVSNVSNVLVLEVWGGCEKYSSVKSPIRGIGWFWAGFGQFWRIFLQFLGGDFRFIHIHQVHRVTMRRIYDLFLIFDVSDVHECMYVMYRKFLKTVRIPVLWLVFTMYMPSTSTYIEGESQMRKNDEKPTIGALLCGIVAMAVVAGCLAVVVVVARVIGK